MQNAPPPPRIVQLLDYDRPKGGSFIAMILAILKEGADRGWKPEVVTFSSAGDAPWIEELQAAGVEVHIAPSELRGRYNRLGGWLRGELADEGRVVLHSHFHGFDIAAVVAARGRTDTHIVWHIHSVYYRDPVRVSKAIAKFAVYGRSVDAYLCPAQNIVDQTVWRGAPRRRVQLVPSAIEIDEFPPVDQAERAVAKRGLGIPESSAALLHFGWHWKLKGGDVFLETLARLRAEGLDVVGVERGGGEEYVRYAEQLGIADALIVQPPVDHVAELHRAADVLVCSSREEGMAYATLEALCSGVPVVATAIPGHVYVGRHVEACRLTGHEPEEIANSTREILERDPAQASREAQEARDWVRQNLSAEVVAGQIVDRYEGFAGSRP